MQVNLLSWPALMHQFIIIGRNLLSRLPAGNTRFRKDLNDLIRDKVYKGFLYIRNRQVKERIHYKPNKNCG